MPIKKVVDITRQNLVEDSKKNLFISIFLFSDNPEDKYKKDGVRKVNKKDDKDIGDYNISNAFGITTYFKGYIPNTIEFESLMDKEFEPLFNFVKAGGMVVIPWDEKNGCSNLGVGTNGLTEKIPGGKEYIEEKIKELEVASTKVERKDDVNKAMVRISAFVNERDWQKKACEEKGGFQKYVEGLLLDKRKNIPMVPASAGPRSSISPLRSSMSPLRSSVPPLRSSMPPLRKLRNSEINPFNKEIKIDIDVSNVDPNDISLLLLILYKLFIEKKRSILEEERRNADGHSIMIPYYYSLHREPSLDSYTEKLKKVINEEEGEEEENSLVGDITRGAIVEKQQKLALENPKEFHQPSFGFFIGIVVDMDEFKISYNDKMVTITIKEVLEGFPAQRAGLRSGNEVKVPIGDFLLENPDPSNREVELIVISHVRKNGVMLNSEDKCVPCLGTRNENGKYSPLKTFSVTDVQNARRKFNDMRQKGPAGIGF